MDQSSEKQIKWYVLQVSTGYEQIVKDDIEKRSKHEGLTQFDKILVPTEEVMEIRAGQKRKSKRKFFPGYVLVRAVMDDATWHFVNKIPHVVGFIGGVAGSPSPISDKEADTILHRMEEGVSKPRPKILFEPGEVVRVIEGPFADFNGVVDEVNYEKSRLRVSVLIFGRSTPVELEFTQVEKG